MQNMNAVEVRQHLRTLGIMGDASGGVQIDIAAAFRESNGSLVENSMCDHNCTTEEGCYDCPAAFNLPDNRGLKRNSMAPAGIMLDRINTAAMGVGYAISMFLESDYHGFCYTSNVQGVVRGVVESDLRQGKIVINIFGGEPTLYPHLPQLLGGLKERGYVRNLTTTGRKWLDPHFVKAIEGVEPEVLALSLDDLTISELQRLSALSSDQIRAEWQAKLKTEPLAGQALKALEAVYILQYYRERGGYPGRLLLNMVLHEGNLSQVREMFDVVAEVAPGTVLNPYADQRAFQVDKETGLRKRGAFGEKELQQFSDFVDWSIEQSKRTDAQIVKRLPHWLLHRAALDVHSGDTQKMADAVAGWNSWRCYNRVGAGFFVQVGSSPKVAIPIMKRGDNAERYPGGHLGCYWDRTTVTDAGQFSEIKHVTDYLHWGNKSLAAANDDPCPGCRMPRLDSLHLVILEQGIPISPPNVKDRYLQLRREHAGF